MRYQTTSSFDADFKKLTAAERKLFRAALKSFVPAAERRAETPAAPWPKSLRVRDVEGARGIWEMTWSFSGPDGRATFEWIRIAGQPAVRWRRIGGHEIFGQP